jgi:O-antigen/teichoic acid export membrane protein
VSLKTSAISGVKWTTLSTAAVTLIQLTQLAILARFLAPGDFGLMAIMMVVIGFSQAFMDMGISNAIIHRQNITHTQLSSLYWLNIGSGLALTVIIFALSPLVALFYDEPRITRLMMILSSVFVIVAIGNQYRILCQKALQFSRMAKIEVTSTVFSFAVAVCLAVAGLGVYALVFAMLTQAFVSSALFLHTGLREHHRPALIFKHSALAGFYSFGLFQMGERSINYFNTQFDVILIGKLLGVEATGIYYIAKTLTMRVISVINPIVNKIALPVMARVQTDDTTLRSMYLTIIRYLSLVNFPIFVAMALLSSPIVLTMFGEKWRDAIVILQILSLYTLIRSTGNPVGSLLLAKGRADLGFYWNFGVFLITPFAIYIGSQHGLAGIALSLLLVSILLQYPSWRFLVNPLCKAGFFEYMKNIFIPLGFVSVAAAATLPFQFVENIYLRSVLVLSVGTVIYVPLIFRFQKDFVNTIISALPWRA